MTEEKKLTQEQIEDAATSELETLAKKWQARSPNAVRDAVLAFADAMAEDPYVEAEDFVATRDLTQEERAEALARIYGYDEDGNEVREDGARR